MSDPSTDDNDTLTANYTDDADLGVAVGVEDLQANVTALTTGGVTDTFESDMGSVLNSNVTVNLLQAGGISKADIANIGSGTTLTGGARVGDFTVDYTSAVSNVGVTGGTGALDVNATASKVSDLTVDGSAGTTTTVNFGAESSDLSVTSGTGAVTVGSAAEIANLTVDASASQ